MQIKITAYILGFLTLFNVLTLFADDNTHKINDRKIKKIIIPWIKKNNIPGLALEVYVMGEPHSYYFGLADKERKISVTSKTLFEVGSFADLFTNLLLAEEVAAGKVLLDDPLSKYTPDLTISSEYLTNVSLLNLATHTSSLSFNVAKEVTTRSQLSEYFSNWLPSSVIGSTWTYSNINSGLLGYVLEASAYENINQLYRSRLLNPLNMGLIGIDVPKEFEGYYAQGYSIDNELIRPDSHSLFPLAGVMKVSGEDMLQFLKAALQLPGVPVKILDAMRMTQTAYVKTDKLSHGLGWKIYPLGDKNRKELMNQDSEESHGLVKIELVEKNNLKFDAYALMDSIGETEGFISYIVVIPARKSGVVVMTNRYISKDEIIKIGRGILFSLNG